MPHCGTATCSVGTLTLKVYEPEQDQHPMDWFEIEVTSHFHLLHLVVHQKDLQGQETMNLSRRNTYNIKQSPLGNG